MNFSTADNALSDKQLREYGEQLTQMRQRLREEALAQANHAKQDDEDVNYQRLARKVHRGYFKKPAKEPANVVL